MTTIDISDRKQGEFWAALAEAEKGDRIVTILPRLHKLTEKAV